MTATLTIRWIRLLAHALGNAAQRQKEHLVITLLMAGASFMEFYVQHYEMDTFDLLTKCTSVKQEETDNSQS